MAIICQVSTKTVVKWTDEDMLECYRVPSKGHGHRRFMREHLLKFIAEHGISTAPGFWASDSTADVKRVEALFIQYQKENFAVAMRHFKAGLADYQQGQDYLSAVGQEPENKRTIVYMAYREGVRLGAELQSHTEYTQKT